MNISWLIPLLFDALRRLRQDTLSDITFTHQQSHLPQDDLYLHETLSQHAIKQLSDTQQFWVNFFTHSCRASEEHVAYLLQNLTVSYAKWQLKSDNPSSFELFRRQQGLMELYAICIELFTGSSETSFPSQKLQVFIAQKKELQQLADAFHDSLQTMSTDPEKFIQTELAFSTGITRLEGSFLEYVGLLFRLTITSVLYNPATPQAIKESFQQYTTPEHFLEYLARVFPEK